MDTVQLQCGSCKKLMAISAEHLGAQVQCPHCRSIVQTVKPAPEPPPAPIAPEEAPPPESLFTDAVPPDAVTSQAPQVEPFAEPAAEASDLAVATLEPPASASAESVPDTGFAPIKPRPVYDKGVFLLIALIFLVPYAIVMTAFVLYLVFVRPAPVDPLEYLRDPVPSKAKGGPKRVYVEPEHDTPIAQHRRTALGKPVEVGDLLVTPEHVMLTAEDDLRLILRAKNISAKTVFEPMNEDYVKYQTSKPNDKPFTFLESRSKSVENLYGANLGYHKDNLAKDDPLGISGALAPGEEIIIALTTYEAYRQKHVPSIATAEDSYLWRVRVRRGFVKVDGKDVSATTVIGVEFSKNDIERAGKS